MGETWLPEFGLDVANMGRQKVVLGSMGWTRKAGISWAREKYLIREKPNLRTQGSTKADLHGDEARVRSPHGPVCPPPSTVVASHLLSMVSFIRITRERRLLWAPRIGMSRGDRGPRILLCGVLQREMQTF